MLVNSNVFNGNIYAYHYFEGWFITSFHHPVFILTGSWRCSRVIQGRKSFSWNLAIQACSWPLPLSILSDASLCVGMADFYTTRVMGIHKSCFAFSLLLMAVSYSVEVYMNIFRREYPGNPTITYHISHLHLYIWTSTCNDLFSESAFPLYCTCISYIITFPSSWDH